MMHHEASVLHPIFQYRKILLLSWEIEYDYWIEVKQTYEMSSKEVVHVWGFSKEKLGSIPPSDSFANKATNGDSWVKSMRLLV